MTRPSYRKAVAWIAYNDEPDETDLEVIEGMISVVLIADLFDLDSSRVARDVLRERQKGN